MNDSDASIRIYDDQAPALAERYDDSALLRVHDCVLNLLPAYRGVSRPIRLRDAALSAERVRALPPPRHGLDRAKAWRTLRTGRRPQRCGRNFAIATGMRLAASDGLTDTVAASVRVT